MQFRRLRMQDTRYFFSSWLAENQPSSHSAWTIMGELAQNNLYLVPYGILFIYVLFRVHLAFSGKVYHFQHTDSVGWSSQMWSDKPGNLIRGASLITVLTPSLVAETKTIETEALSLGVCPSRVSPFVLLLGLHFCASVYEVPLE